MKSVIGLLAFSLILLGAGCAPSAVPADDSSFTQSTALAFHLETAIADLESAIAVEPDDSVAFVKGSVTYAGLTLPQAAEIAAEEGDTATEATILALDAELKAVLADATTLDELVTGVESVIAGLRAL